MRERLKRTAWVVMAAAGGVGLALVPAWASLARQPDAPAAAATRAQPAYVRTVTNDATGAATLEVAIRSFTITDPAGKPRTVHLVGAVHIADKSFYDAVQVFLDKQDLVLYEGVRPPGAGRFDDHPDDHDQADATRKRMAFLLTVMDRHRAEHKAYPSNRQELTAKASDRVARLLPELMTDAWGHEIIVKRVDALAGKAGDAPDAPEAWTEQVIIISAGPDGDIATEADNLRVEGQAHPAGKPVKGTKDAPNIQQQLADALGLTFQMKGIDYSRANMRPSDLSMDQIQDRIAKAGGNADMLFQMLDGNSLAGRLVGVLMGLIKSSPAMSGMVKIMIVDMLGQAESLLGEGGMSMPGMEQMGAAMKVILGDRNQVVIADLKRVLADEPQFTSIAAFYGAGHLAAMEKDLIAMGATVTGEQWIAGITADPEKMGMSKAEVDMTRKMIRSQMDAMKKMQERAARKKGAQPE